MYAVIVTSLSDELGRNCSDKNRYWVVNDIEGWVEATSTPCYDSNQIPRDVKVFESEEDIKKFLKRWKGHPWWCRPNGDYEAIRIEPNYITIQDGYVRVN